MISAAEIKRKCREILQSGPQVSDEERQIAQEYLEAQAHCEAEAARFEDDIQDHLRRMHRNDTPDNRAIVFRHMGIY